MHRVCRNFSAGALQIMFNASEVVRFEGLFLREMKRYEFENFTNPGNWLEDSHFNDILMQNSRIFSHITYKPPDIVKTLCFFLMKESHKSYQNNCVFYFLNNFHTHF